MFATNIQFSKSILSRFGELYLTFNLSQFTMFGIRFLISVMCVHLNTSLDVQKLLYQYVAVCGFEYLCDPQAALLSNMTTVPNISIHGQIEAMCQPCLCTDDCGRYVIYYPINNYIKKKKNYF